VWPGKIWFSDSDGLRDAAFVPGVKNKHLVDIREAPPLHGLFQRFVISRYRPRHDGIINSRHFVLLREDFPAPDVPTRVDDRTLTVPAVFMQSTDTVTDEGVENICAFHSFIMIPKILHSTGTVKLIDELRICRLSNSSAKPQRDFSERIVFL
jgi:hypothetical protein